MPKELETYIPRLHAMLEELDTIDIAMTIILAESNAQAASELFDALSCAYDSIDRCLGCLNVLGKEEQ